MRVLMLIPSVIKRGIDTDVAADSHPRMDYHVLADCLADAGCRVDMVGYAELPGTATQLRDLRLAMLGYVRRRSYDAIFCNSESVALPLAALLRRDKRRPRVVVIGHRVSSPKKRLLFTRLGSASAIDTLFLYSTEQLRYAIDSLGLSEGQAKLIAFHADTRFFRPAETAPGLDTSRTLVSSAGLEWRDYPTLIEAARGLPHVDFYLAASSPWSKHRDRTSGTQLPPNITVSRLDYNALRSLYQRSACVVTPLYETDFQAGVTTILEAMACGKPVIASRTVGQTDVIVHEENGVYVPPADSAALRSAISAVLSDSARAASLGASARRWVEENAGIERWSSIISRSIRGAQ